MIDLQDLYFRWLMGQFDEPTNATFERLCMMLHGVEFRRRVGMDVNRADDGLRLRANFLQDFEDMEVDPLVSNAFLEEGCTWLEMLIALATRLDFLYDGGVKERFLELITNMGLLKVLFTTLTRSGKSQDDAWHPDYVAMCCACVDENRFSPSGKGGLFPLMNPERHADQRTVEIWAQHAAYFVEKLEGIMWTSTD